MITVNFAGSNTTSLDLHSLYYGCLDTLVGAPLACTVAISGYQGVDYQVINAERVCAQELEYKPPSSIGQHQMADSGTLNACFKDLAFVLVNVTLEGVLAAANTDATLALDEVSITTRKCQVRG